MLFVSPPFVWLLQQWFRADTYATTIPEIIMKNGDKIEKVE